MKKKRSITGIREVIADRRRNIYVKKGYRGLMVRVLLLVLIGYLMLTQVFLITQAKGNEMFPAIKEGDLIIAFRLQKEYVKNDIVVYKRVDSTHLARVVARGRDVVTLDDSGELLVNGTVQRGEIIYPTYAKEGLLYPLRIEEETVFLLGDYRTQAQDSRDFGPIDLKNVEGKVITILRRRGL